MRYAQWLLLVFLVGPIHAVGIQEPITQGTADIVPDSLFSTTGLETFSVGGPDFSFSGSGNQLFRFYSCGTPCPVGAQIYGQGGDIGTGTGVPISGNITFQGASFDYTETPASGFAWLTGNFNLSAPGPYFPPQHATLTAPVHMTAIFLDSNFHGGDIFFFSGQGFVTLNLTLVGPLDVGQFYALQSMHFDFVSDRSRVRSR